MSDEMVLGHVGHSPDFKSPPSAGILPKEGLVFTGPPTKPLRIALPDSRGGDVILSPGQGRNAPDGSIIFQLNSGQEMIRLDADGKIYVRGNEVDDDPLVYIAFRDWLKRVVTDQPDPTAIELLGAVANDE